MKRDRITPGIILVFIGAVILLCNFGYLHFHIMNFFHMWPVFLVIAGVNLLLANRHEAWVRITKAIVLLVGLFIIFFGDVGGRNWFFPGFYHYSYHNNNNDADDDDDDDSSLVINGKVVKIDGNSFYHTDFAPGTKLAHLNLSGGGTTYLLSDTTNSLFAADVKEYYGHYHLENHSEDSVATVDFDMNGNHNGHWNWGSGNDKSNKATLKLNPVPVWEINVNAGATDLNFDLSKFKVSACTINGGAASFKVRVGEPVAGNTDITVKSGVSDITIEVPKDAACSIVSSTGLSSNTYSGFNKTSGNDYETQGFGAAKNRIYINISGGLSDFKVNRY